MGYKSNLRRIYLIRTSVFECTDVVIKGLQLLKEHKWGRIGNRKKKRRLDYLWLGIYGLGTR